MRKHADDRAGEQVRLDAKVEQPRDRAGRVVGMERAENFVARERRLDGHRGRLVVADLADHDHVRVLPQDAAQSAGERHALLVAHLRLADPLQAEFDRVFEREDVLFRVVQLLKHGVERRALAAAGRTGHEIEPMLGPDELAELGERLRRNAELLERVEAGALVEQTDDDALAETRRQRGNAQVD